LAPVLGALLARVFCAFGAFLPRFLPRFWRASSVRFRRAFLVHVFVGFWRTFLVWVYGAFWCTFLAHFWRSFFARLARSPQKYFPQKPSLKNLPQKNFPQKNLPQKFWRALFARVFAEFFRAPPDQSCGPTSHLYN